jgi:hypothetical protein
MIPFLRISRRRSQLSSWLDLEELCTLQSRFHLLDRLAAMWICSASELAPVDSF